jgi:hypothetical protein
MDGVEIFVPLTRGLVAVVDLEDWDAVRPHKWRASRSSNGKTYAGRTVHEKQPYLTGVRKSKTVLMHRELLGNSNGDIDHQDGNTLNNKRPNLRAATRSQNCGNQKIRSTNKSGFKGVYWKQWRKIRGSGAWAAIICVNYKKTHLGYFSTAEEAAHAYDSAAQHQFGEFAKLNFAKAS